MIPRRHFLATAIAPTLLPQQPASPPDPLAAPLLQQVRIGAEFFLNTTETRDTVNAHFRAMRACGLTIARIFTLWDHVERVQGQFDFSRYDWIYDAARDNGIFIANTLCAEDPPGWMRTAPFYHQWQDLSNPALRPHAETYIQRVVQHYRNHPAHGVWLLQNEPGFREDGSQPYALAAFAAWLRRKYGSVAELNRRWYRTLDRFEDVPLPIEGRLAGWQDYPSLLDWRRFRSDHLAAQLQWIRSRIDLHHPGALTHINPPGQTSNMPASGRDMWKLKPTAHFMGSSMHAAWHFGMFARHDFGVAYGFCCDLVRSVSAPAPWWVTELQAGTTVFTGSRPLLPTPGEIERWLWDGIGNGARGIVFWLWHPRTEGNEAGEWGLAGPSGEETERTRATRAVARTLQSRQSLFAAARPLPAQAAILYNRDTLLLYPVDAWRRPTDEVVHSLMGCYKALHRAHIPVDFLDTAELEAGAASKYRILYLPYCYALSAASVRAIRQFVAQGGAVWADGLVAWKNEEGVTRRFPPGDLADVFGVQVEEIVPEWEPFEYAPGDGKTGELWRCAGPGIQGLVQHPFGQGRAFYCGTALTLGYLRRENPQAASWIATPALQLTTPPPITLGPGHERVAQRLMQCPGGHLAILTNWGPEVELALRLPPGARVTELITGQTAPPARLAAGASAVFLVQSA